MVHKIKLNYINPKLNIGMQDIKHVYHLKDAVLLQPEVYRGKLVYRAKGSSKKISYNQLKKGLMKQVYWIKMEVPNWFI
ncbi:MAG TPA: hypothetical protein VNS32_19455 [Flavisolibacter sp.]|nr:hypothetical protein [Flavisolibacter sp.]